MRKNLKTYPSQQYRQRVLIACCGETETHYFQHAKRDVRGKYTISVQTVPKDPDAILAKILREDISKFNYIWLVVDKDSFLNIQTLITKAKLKNIRVIYSNPCFELWIYLHFEELNTTLTNKEYISKIEKFINKKFKLASYKYEKGDRKMHEYIRPYRMAAIKRSEKLMKHWSTQGKINADKNNPSTNIASLMKAHFI